MSEPVKQEYETVNKSPDRCPFCGDGDLNFYPSRIYKQILDDETIETIELQECQCSNEVCGLSFWV